MGSVVSSSSIDDFLRGDSRYGHILHLLQQDFLQHVQRIQDVQGARQVYIHQYPLIIVNDEIRVGGIFKEGVWGDEGSTEEG